MRSPRTAEGADATSTDGTTSVAVSEWRSLGLVVSREVREALRRKTLWIASAIALLATTALMVLPLVISSSDDVARVGVVGQSGTLEAAVAAVGTALEIQIDVTEPVDAAVARQAVSDGDLDAAIVLGDPTRLIAKDGGGSLVTALRQVVATDSSVAALRDAGLSESQINDALASPPLQLDLIDADRSGRFAAAQVVSIVVYLLLMTVTMQVANGVAIEKSNRVSEVLLAIVSARSLMFGKVIGVVLMAMLPLTAGAIPVVIRLSTSGGLPPDTGVAVAAGAAWFLLGAGFYLLAAAALGSLVERQEEAGSAVVGLTVILIVSYIVGISAADTPLGAVLAYIPFSSPMVEPARLALGVSSTVEVVATLVISIVTVVVMGRLSAAIYQRAVVRTGRRLHLRDVFRAA